MTNLVYLAEIILVGYRSYSLREGLITTHGTYQFPPSLTIYMCQGKLFSLLSLFF